MQLAIVGLGRMGGNIARRLMKHGHEVVVYDAKQVAMDELARERATSSSSLADLVKKLKVPRAVWVMLPAGSVTEDTIRELATLLQKGDTIIDGGNTFYRDDIRRAQMLAKQGLHYVDCGTSGGVWGLERGYCMMIGGEKDVVARLDPIFCRAGARRRHHRQDTRPRGPRSARRTGLYSRRAGWRRAFRQDDP